MVEIRTDRLTLRPVVAEDARAFREIMNDPEMGLHTDVPRGRRQ